MSNCYARSKVKILPWWPWWVSCRTCPYPAEAHQTKILTFDLAQKLYTWTDFHKNLWKYVFWGVEYDGKVNKSIFERESHFSYKVTFLHTNHFPAQSQIFQMKKIGKTPIQKCGGVDKKKYMKMTLRSCQILQKKLEQKHGSKQKIMTVWKTFEAILGRFLNIWFSHRDIHIICLWKRCFLSVLSVTYPSPQFGKWWPH